MIRRLQKEHLPLNEIRRQLNALSDDQVLRALLGGSPSPKTKSSALDYIQSVKVSAGVPSFARTPRPMLDAVTSVTPDAAASSPARHSQWERIALNEDLELHIRRPLSRERNRFVDRLLAFAKQMTKEDQS